MMTLRDKLNETQRLIKGYKDYLLTRGVDARAREHAWMITERDEQDELDLINEISRLGHIAQQLKIQGIVDPAYLDETYHCEAVIFESLENKTIVKL